MVTTIYNTKNGDYMMFESSYGTIHVLAPGHGKPLILPHGKYKVSAIAPPSEPPVLSQPASTAGAHDVVEVTNVGDKSLLFYLRTYGPHVGLKPETTAILQDKEYELYIQEW
ncbi:hypothetical protein APHAL10511_008241 [Amanita phalloides]|nr:hypothetical protein APHAL10511_008241 [Amanita phalloides]